MEQELRSRSEQTLLDADEASRILNSPMLQEFYRVSRAEALEAIVRTKGAETEEREMLYHRLKNLDAFMGFLSARINSGKIERDKIQKASEREAIRERHGEKAVII